MLRIRAGRPTAGHDPGPWMLTDNADHIIALDAAGDGILNAGLGGQPASSSAPDRQGGLWSLVDRYPAPPAPASGVPSGALWLSVGSAVYRIG